MCCFNFKITWVHVTVINVMTLPLKLGGCEGNNMWLTAAHISGAQNITADYGSRYFNTDVELMLNSKILTKALQGISFSPTIVMFASRLNKQFPQYVSYRPDQFGHPHRCIYNITGYLFSIRAKLKVDGFSCSRNHRNNFEFVVL